MARLITLIFIATAYLGPERVFGSLVVFHVQIIIGLIAILVSLPGALKEFNSPSPQSIALLGLVAAVFLSLVANRWFSGAVNAVDLFLPQVMPFFLVVFNFKTKRDLQFLIIVLLAVCSFVIYSGYTDLQANKTDSPYLIAQDNDQGERFYRLRGETFIGDPNDFAQLLVCLVPLTFLFWTRKKKLQNFLVVYLPIAGLFFGMYLTHSRGGVIALVALLMVAARKKVGAIPGAIIAGLGFMGVMALGWTGGRGISVEAGTGRMDAWAEGLQLIQSHPIFGVGYNRFTEFYYITAHNTIVVCAAELGLLGFFFWVLFVVPSFLTSWKIANPIKETAAKMPMGVTNVGPIRLSQSFSQPPNTEVVLVPEMTENGASKSISLAELPRLAQIMVLTLTGFLMAGWFISRSYVMTLFIFGAITVIIFKRALEVGIVSRISFVRLVKMSAGWTVGLLVLVYVVLRVSNLMR